MTEPMASHRPVQRVVAQPLFGVAPGTATRLLALFDGFPGLDAVWIFGSRARGTQRHESDIDLAVDAPGISERQFLALKSRIEALELLYRTDVVWLQAVSDPQFRAEIMNERQVFWRAATSSVSD